jgi:hypothetical protein
MIEVLRRAAPQDRRRKIRLLAEVIGFTATETKRLINDPEILYRALIEITCPTAR